MHALFAPFCLETLLFFFEQAIDFVSQLQQAFGVLLDCGLGTDVKPALSHYAPHLLVPRPNDNPLVQLWREFVPCKSKSMLAFVDVFLRDDVALLLNRYRQA